MVEKRLTPETREEVIAATAAAVPPEEPKPFDEVLREVDSCDDYGCNRALPLTADAPADQPRWGANKEKG